MRSRMELMSAGRATKIGGFSLCWDFMFCIILGKKEKKLTCCASEKLTLNNFHRVEPI